MTQLWFLPLTSAARSQVASRLRERTSARVLARLLVAAVLPGLPVPAATQSGAASNAPVLQLQVGHNAVGSLPISLSPAGNLMATAGSGNALKLWELDGGRLVCTLDVVVEGTRRASSRPGSLLDAGEPNVAWSADGTRLLTPTGGNRFRLWDLRRCGESTEIALDLSMPSRQPGRASRQADRVDSIRTLAGNRVLVRVNDGLLVFRPFDVPATAVAEQVRPFSEGATRPGPVIGQSEDGRIVLTSRGVTLDPYVHGLDDGAPISLLSFSGVEPGFRETLQSDRQTSWPPMVAVSRSGRLIATAVREHGVIRLFDVAQRRDAGIASVPTDLQMQPGQPMPVRGCVQGLAFSSDERQIFAACGSRVTVLRSDTLQPMRVIDLPVAPAGLLTTRIPLHVVRRAEGDLLLVQYSYVLGPTILALPLHTPSATPRRWVMDAPSRIMSLAFPGDTWVAHVESWLGDAAGRTPSSTGPAVRDALPLELRAQHSSVHLDAWGDDSHGVVRQMQGYTGLADGNLGAFSSNGAFHVAQVSRFNLGQVPRPASIMSTELSLRDVSTAQARWTRDIGTGARYARSLAVSEDGRLVALWRDRALQLIDGASGRDLQVLDLPSNALMHLAFSADGRSLMMASPFGDAALIDVAEPGAAKALWSAPRSRETVLGFLPKSTRFLLAPTAQPDGRQVLPDIVSATVLRIPVPLMRGLAVPNRAENLVAVAQEDRRIRLVDIAAVPPRVVGELAGPTAQTTALAFSPDGRWLVSGDEQGNLWLWSVSARQLVARMLSFGDGSWVVVDPQGRFDTNNVEGLNRLHWILPGEPFKAYGLELFMRDYYVPSLLRKLLAGAALPPLPAIDAINRLQPEVRIAAATLTASGTVDLTVNVRGHTDERR